MAKHLRRYLRITLLNLLLAWLRLGRLFLADRRAVLVIPPDDLGSTGDEAMMTATVAWLRGHGATRIGIVTYGDPVSWESRLAVDEKLDMGEFFSRASRRDELRFSRYAGRFGRVYVTGADVMDGYYSPRDTVLRARLLVLAARTGARTRLLGFSFNAEPAPEAVAALRALPPRVELCARDPVSHARLANHVGRPVRLAADLAFLLEPSPTNELPKAVLRWIEGERREGRLIVGVNANYLAFKEHAQVEAVVAAFAQAIGELCASGQPASFLLLPHDAREPHSDVTLAAAIHDRLPPSARARSLSVSTALPAAQIKALCGQLDFALSSRMHLAIACLGQGTPVACIAYQGKFEGLFEHFRLDNMLLDAAAALAPGGLAAFLAASLERRDATRAAIAAGWPEVRRLAEANFTN